MNIPRLPALALLLVAFAAHAVARDDKASLAVTRAKFEKQDAELNAVYKTLITSLGKTAAVELRKDEKIWLEYRDAMSENAHHFSTGTEAADPKATMEYWDFMESFTTERIEFLRAWTGKDVPPGISGEYSDCHGSSLFLEETKSGIKFSIEAVRGLSAHTGEISGIIHPKGNTARFVEQSPTTAVPPDPPCVLTFTFIDGHIVAIAQKNPDPGAGMGVYYDGRYYKTGKLKEHVELQ